MGRPSKGLRVALLARLPEHLKGRLDEVAVTLRRPVNDLLVEWIDLNVSAAEEALGFQSGPKRGRPIDFGARWAWLAGVK